MLSNRVHIISLSLIYIFFNVSTNWHVLYNCFKIISCILYSTTEKTLHIINCLQVLHKSYMLLYTVFWDTFWSRGNPIAWKVFHSINVFFPLFANSAPKKEYFFYRSVFYISHSLYLKAQYNTASISPALESSKNILFLYDFIDVKKNFKNLWKPSRMCESILNVWCRNII